MTLDELTSAIEGRAAGRDLTLSWLDRWDGSQVGAATIGTKLFATWQAELANAPIFDGVTPRGPRDYRALKFFDGPAGDN